MILLYTDIQIKIYISNFIQEKYKIDVIMNSCFENNFFHKFLFTYISKKLTDKQISFVTKNKIRKKK